VKLLCAALGSLFAVSVPTACGGSEALSNGQRQYVSRLNAMCRDFSRREQTIGEPQTLEDLAVKGPRVVDAFEKAIVDKIHRLEAPDEISDQANRLTRLADEQRDVLSGLVDAAKRSDFEKVGELSSRNAMLNDESGSIASELGATACATDESR
jgi:hypothetical protein